MDHLMKRVNRDGLDVARRYLIERADLTPGGRASSPDLSYLRGELAGIARCAWYVIGGELSDIEKYWIEEAGKHFAVVQAQQGVLRRD